MNRMTKVIGAVGGLMVLGVAGTAAAEWGVNLTVHSGADAKYCMDVKGGGKGAGTPVQVWSCTRSENQRWAMARGTDDWGHLVGTGGLCLALHDGKPAYTYGCADTDNQKFKVDGSGRLTHKESGKCVTIQNIGDGQLLELAACDATPKQTWTFQSE
jgi:hypothetical protein